MKIKPEKVSRFDLAGMDSALAGEPAPRQSEKAQARAEMKSRKAQTSQELRTLKQVCRDFKPRKEGLMRLKQFLQ